MCGKMRIIITGADGYLGWPLLLYLAEKGHEVLGLDNLARRGWVEKSNSDTAIQITKTDERLRFLQKNYYGNARIHFCDLSYPIVVNVQIQEFIPEVIINLAAQPSAPYSMQSVDQALETQRNNIAITMNLLWAIKEHVPKCRFIHTSTMGEYGQPAFPIPEHSLIVTHKSRKSVVPLGRQPGSFYHASKVLDTHNILLACKNWGIEAQVLMTAVVYGVNCFVREKDPEAATRFDFDINFGTVLNRFVSQALIGHSLTVFGKGDQIRAFISLEDFVKSTAKMIKEKIPTNKANSKFIVYNQVTEYVSINELAILVKENAKAHKLDVVIKNISNPRVEKEVHYYDVETEKFDKVHKKTRSMSFQIDAMFKALANVKSQRVILDHIESI